MYGLQFKNADGDILIDSNFHHYHFVGHAVFHSAFRIPALTGGNNTSHSYTGSQGLSSTQINGDVFKYRITCSSNSPVPPIVFIKPSYTGSGAPYCGLILTQKISASVWEFWVLQDYGFIRPSLFCFNRFDQMDAAQLAKGDNTNQGILTYNSAGTKTYDTRYKPLKIVGTRDINAPVLARNSVASSYNPDFTPTNYKDFPIAPATGSLGDLMFYAPSLAHSCQSTTATRDGDGFQASGYNSYFYAWARMDLWWCFYRNTFRLLNVNTLQSKYSIYASGHVYKSVEDKTSIFDVTNVLTAFFTFGAGLTASLVGLTITAGVAGAFNDAGAVTGVYLPYDNSSRNASELQPLLLSRASYYGLEDGITYVPTDQVGGALPTDDPNYIPNYVYVRTLGSESFVAEQITYDPDPQIPPQKQMVIYWEGVKVVDVNVDAALESSIAETNYYDTGGYRYYIGNLKASETDPEVNYYEVGRDSL